MVRIHDRVRITVRSSLIATAWMGVFFLLCMTPLSGTPNVYAIPLAVLRFVVFSIAVGALVQETIFGAVIGLLLGLAYVAFALLVSSAVGH